MTQMLCFLWFPGYSEVQNWKLRPHHLHPASAALAAVNCQQLMRGLLSWCMTGLYVVPGTALSCGHSEYLTLNSMRRTRQTELLRAGPCGSTVTFPTAGLCGSVRWKQAQNLMELGYTATLRVHLGPVGKQSPTAASE